MKSALHAASLFTATAMPLHAQDTSSQSVPLVLAQAPQANPVFVKTEGEVIRVDKEAKKLTIRHRQITSPDMPAMSMAFQVKDFALLDKVKFLGQFDSVRKASVVSSP